ncbi:hypothetical protein Glove_724g2 [Diversispora epigaea]|uniref:Uncharacterized protein n=1 Tax=Diversispora epigaea TaxID=1348612 RepID=A0A397G0I5_9GLOM|nr:hypothetical protein Glove_724g2 [Diversispora epigaea]
MLKPLPFIINNNNNNNNNNRNDYNSSRRTIETISKIIKEDGVKLIATGSAYPVYCNDLLAPPFSLASKFSGLVYMKKNIYVQIDRTQGVLGYHNQAPILYVPLVFGILKIVKDTDRPSTDDLPLLVYDRTRDSSLSTFSIITLCDCCLHLKLAIYYNLSLLASDKTRDSSLPAETFLA